MERVLSNARAQFDFVIRKLAFDNSQDRRAIQQDAERNRFRQQREQGQR